MALDIRPMDARVQYQLDMGLDEKGRKVTRSKSLSKVKSTANDQDIYDVVAAVTELQSRPVISIRKTAQSELANI